jgi:hypothetical protein
VCLSFAFLFASALQHAFFPFAEGWQGMRDGFESVRTHIEHQGQRMLLTKNALFEPLAKG